MRFKFIALGALLSAFCFSASAQGTAFTYQGRLMDTSVPANGLYDIRGGLYASSSGGALVSALYTNSAVPVSNGLFTITMDFGDLYNGTPYWLQIGVRSNGSGVAFSPLSGRQALTPAPYAIYSENAGLAVEASGVASGTVAASQLNTLGAPGSGQVLAYNGSSLVWTNPSTASLAWNLIGNAGTSPTSGNYVGTTDNNPLELHVNGVRALRLEPTANDANHSNIVNVVQGSPVNYAGAGVYGATISGGGARKYSGTTGTNGVTADFGTVGGGLGNLASGAGSVIGGGGWEGSTVFGNTASATASVVGGGIANQASFFAATVAGGEGNTASGNTYGWTTIGGGADNVASGDFAIVGGGYDNIASGAGSFVGGGGADGSTSGPFSLLNSWPNKASGKVTVIGGGLGNTNTVYGGTIGGGTFNTVKGTNSTVPGGYQNSVTGTGSFAAGQYAQTSNDGTFIWGDGTQTPFTGTGFDDSFNVLASGGAFFFNGAAGVHIDYLNQNSGTIQYGLRFGAGSSGEGIASERMAGANQYGLDFYTGSANRMSIASGGFVGINTNNPSQRLEVNGNYVLIDGGASADHNGPIDAYIGGDGSGSDVQIGSMNSLITSVGFWNNAAGAWMHIACSSISINGGSDLAEPFDISGPASELQQGSVVVIDDQNPGRLKLSDRAYDRRVAGVLSGANGVNPGIQMRQQALLDGGKNVALTGRVYVRADATTGAIEPGDLLTTSNTPGHAMKVTDPARAQGAVLGKAMSRLSDGKGMVLVLVSLQ